MARSDWVVLVCEPMGEYYVRDNLARLDLCPYVPQSRRNWFPPDGGSMIRLYPVFPCAILLPLPQLDVKTFAHVPRLRRRPSPILTTPTDGRG
jgi:hypothetical protein